MSNVKYEAVFGPQELFEDAKDNVVAIGYIPGDFKSKICCTKEQLEGLEQSDYIHYPIIAMRRIIKTPVWTVADQQAGRLPEVGCEVKAGSNIYTVEAVNAGKHQLCVRDNHDGDLSITYMQYIQPFKTPEERAERLRSEWVKRALDLYISSPKNDVASMGDVYDALLSGELQVPAQE